MTNGPFPLSSKARNSKLWRLYGQIFIKRQELV